MFNERVEVECYSGHRVNERPLAFTLRGQRFEVEELVDRWYDMWMREGNREAQLDRLKQYKSGDIEGVIRRLRPPTLLMWGEANTTAKFEQAEHFRELLENVESLTYISYPGVGHMAVQEAGEETGAPRRTGPGGLGAILGFECTVVVGTKIGTEMVGEREMGPAFDWLHLELDPLVRTQLVAHSRHRLEYRNRAAKGRVVWRPPGKRATTPELRLDVNHRKHPDIQVLGSRHRPPDLSDFDRKEAHVLDRLAIDELRKSIIV